MLNYYNLFFLCLSCIVLMCGKVFVFLFDNKNNILDFKYCEVYFLLYYIICSNLNVEFLIIFYII